MLEKDKQEEYEKAGERTGMREILAGGRLAAWLGNLVGTGEEIRPQGRRLLLLAGLLAVALTGFLCDVSDEAEPEMSAFVTTSAPHASDVVQHEEAAGAKEAQEGKALADPFCLLHSDEQATLAAMVAVGGGDAASPAAGRGGSPAAPAGIRSDMKEAKDASTAGRSEDKAAAAVPLVRGTVTSSVGTVLLLSVGERDFFLSEGEEKDGVLLQSLSEKSAVVVVSGRAYTLSLPG